MSALLFSAVTTFFMLGIPALFVLVLTFINKNSKKFMVERFSSNSLEGFKLQEILGGLGIIMHESSHAIMALIFGHRITAFKPLILPRNVMRNHGMLGYVNNTYNPRSTYQSLGKLFIGTAPIWGCTASIYFIIKYTMPHLYRYLVIVEHALITLKSENIKSALFNFTFLHDILTDSNLLSILIALLGLVFITNIALGGFDLSSKDLQNALPAFIVLFINIFLILYLATIIHLSAVISSISFKLIIVFSIVMSLSVILSLLANLGLRIFGFFA